VNKRILTSILALISALVFFASTAQSTDIDLKFVFAASSLTDGTTLRDPSGLAVSRSTGDIAVADTGNGRIRIFSADGVVITSIGPATGIESPIGVAVDENDEIYVSEMDGAAIKRFSVAGTSLPPILPEETGEKPVRPGRMCIASDGTLVVTDRAAQRIFVIGDGGKTIRQISHKPEPGEPDWSVQDVAIDKDKNVYVVSSKGLAIRVYDFDGSYVRSFGTHGSKDDEFSFPTGAEIGPDGNLWIVDSFRQEIKVFTTDGDFLFRWGETGAEDGKLFYPVDIAFGEGMLYVLEKGAGRLQAFKIP